MKPLQLWSLFLALTIALASHVSRAELTVEGGLGGHMVAEVDGQQIALPTLKTEITGDLQGDLATITVRQVFANPTLTPMNARYLFPLNKDAAVHAMQMQVVPHVDGAYELRVPLVVGPRHIPQGGTSAAQMVEFSVGDTKEEGFLPEAAAQPAFGEWRFPPVPTYPEVARLPFRH